MRFVHLSSRRRSWDSYHRHILTALLRRPLLRFPERSRLRPLFPFFVHVIFCMNNSWFFLQSPTAASHKSHRISPGGVRTSHCPLRTLYRITRIALDRTTAFLSWCLRRFVQSLSKFIFCCGIDHVSSHEASCQIVLS